VTATKLAIRRPTTALESSRSWQNPADRKRRAAQALRDRDHATLADLFVAYLTRTRGTPPSRHTVVAYTRGMEDLLAWCEAGHAEGRLAHQLTREDAEAYRLWLTQAGGRGGAPLKPASANARLAAARQFTEALLWADLVTATPFGGLKGVRDPQDPASKRDPFEAEELARLLAAAEADPRRRVLVLLGADGGLRLAEAAGLTWVNVNLATLKAWVLGKGAKERCIGLTPRLAQALADLGPGEPGQKVLGVNPRRVQAIFARLCERAGVDRRGTHTTRGYHALRHSCATRMYRETGDLGLVARHLGHASTDTTRTYARMDEARYAEAVAALGEPTTPPTAGEGADETAGELAEALARRQAAREELAANDAAPRATRERLAATVAEAEADVEAAWAELRGMMGATGATGRR